MFPWVVYCYIERPAQSHIQDPRIKGVRFGQNIASERRTQTCNGLWGFAPSGLQGQNPGQRSRREDESFLAFA